MDPAFSYETAFARNIGWLLADEQQRLKRCRVAIAGMGGVGGFHLLALARLGVGAFHVADFDRFDLANFNRQVGASCSTLQRPKVDVLAEMALDINPELEITRFEQGVDGSNLAQFLGGVDLYVDGLDFFAFQARRATFAACRAAGIPAVTAAPLGMGAAVLNFLPQGISFEDYFQWGDRPEDEMALRFLVGLAPRGLHRPYLVDPSTVNLAERRGPSTIMGCQLCAGVAATEALKLLLGRKPVRAAPHGYQFDAYRQRLVHTWRPGGNRHPMQRLALAIGMRQIRRLRSEGGTL